MDHAVVNQTFAFAVGAAVTAIVCGGALARGGWPERLAAATTLIGSLLTPLVQSQFNRQGQPGVWIVDIICTGIYLYIALKSDRWWPFYAVAFRIGGLLGHVVNATFAYLPIKLYATTEIMWGYLGLFALGAGVLEVEARRWTLRRSRPLPT